MKGKKVPCPVCGTEVFRYESPVPTVDIIIETEAQGKKGIVLIFRKMSRGPGPYPEDS